jgi:hypothetical protein
MALPGAIYGPQFESLQITDSINLFFDDQSTNVVDVQRVANENDWNLKSVLCLPDNITLYGTGTGATGKTTLNCFKGKTTYGQLKKLDPGFAEDFKARLASSYEIGTGITREIIQKIIENETEPEPKRTGLYFFDFDMLLNQFGGLNFPENPAEATPEWLEQYAKYIFSDHIGLEPEGGRLNLLKRMFEAIGPDRIYVITANPYAGAQFTNDKGRVLNPNPYLDVFIKLLQVLLPSFVPDHLVCTAGKKKSAAIMVIMDARASRGGSKSRRKSKTKTRKTRTRSKARKTRTKSKARKTKVIARNHDDYHKPKCI